MTDQLPATHAEAYRWIARWVIGPNDLVRAYVGDIETARSNITSGMSGRSGNDGTRGYRATVQGRDVHYWIEDGPAGTVKIAALLRLAAASATRGAVDRLTTALAEWSATHRDQERILGPGRTMAAHQTPAYRAWIEREHAARRELTAARDAWWDGQPGVQLDLFGAAS